MRNQTKNVCFVIRPYRIAGSRIWAFDDEQAGLNREPFVGTTNDVIDAMLTRSGCRAETVTQFTLMFSASSFPKYDACFEVVQENGQSAWFFDKYTGLNFWLCPALGCYFRSPPERLYAKISDVIKKVV